MNKEEAKQYLRFQIDSSIKKQYSKDIFHLYYNKQYLRALKLSKITGQPVNENNFKGGEKRFGFNSEDKRFWAYSIIEDYLYDNYSKKYSEHWKLVNDIINEYEEYKDYKYW